MPNGKKRIQELCDETEVVTQTLQSEILCKDTVKERFNCWISGFGVSCVPILGSLIVQVLIGGVSLFDSMLHMLDSSEIIFLGISIAVTAMYDYVTYQKKFSWLYIIIVLLGTVIYTVISMIENMEDINANFFYIRILNICFLSLVLIRGGAQYYKQYSDLKRRS